MEQYYCQDCKEPCNADKSVNDEWVSDCCAAHITEDTPEEQRMNEAEYKQER